MKNEHGRYCESCQHEHGPLYICASYSDDLKTSIEAEQEQYVAMLNDPKWIEQMNKKDPLAVHIFRAFTGLDPL
jgi:hypothetical protein